MGERVRGGASSSHDERGSGPVRVSVSVVVTEEVVLPCLLVPGDLQRLVHRGEKILTQRGNLHGPGERDGGRGRGRGRGEGGRGREMGGEGGDQFLGHQLTNTACSTSANL